MFWPLLLTGAGVALLLSNLGYVPRPSWQVLGQLWPLLLVGLGIDTLIGRRTMVGAIVSGLLILSLIGGALAFVFLAEHIPAPAAGTPATDWQVEHIAYPSKEVERATVEIDWTSVPGRLRALSDAANLIQGDVAYLGEMIFDVQALGDRAEVKLDHTFGGPWPGPFGSDNGARDRWDIGLSPEVPLALDLNTGAGRCDLDLTALRVSNLHLDVGSGPTDLVLPSDSTFDAHITGGAGRLNIVLPENVGARVTLESGSGLFRPDGRFRLVDGERNDDGTWETGNYATAEHTIDLTIDQGAGRITIR